MDRDEILEKSRIENKKMDEREMLAHYQGGYISHSIGLFLCSTVNLLNSDFNGPRSVQHAVWLVFFGMCAANLGTIAKKSEKKTYWILTIISVLIFVINIGQFITHLIEGT